eukprot:2232919-Amphidinium_carterae.1
MPLRASAGLMLSADPQLATVDVGKLHHALLLQHWTLIVRSGIIDPVLLLDAVHGAAIRLSRARRPWPSVLGPASALLTTLVRLNWAMLSPTTLQTDLHTRLDMQQHGPALLAQEAKDASIRWSDRQACHGRGLPAEPLLWHPLHRVHARLTHPLDKFALANTAALGQWTQATMHSRGAAETPWCPRCQELGSQVMGTQRHRLLECPYWSVE